MRGPETARQAVSRYLVTGCAGFIGSHLAEALIAAGDDVVGVDAFTDYYARELKERNVERIRESSGFKLVEDDLAEANLEQLLDGVDAIFHLAAQPGVRGSWGRTFEIYVRDNVAAMQRLLEAAAKRRLRVVYASSSSIYGNAGSYPTPEDARPAPISPYGVTKLCCEQLAAAYAACFGHEAVGLRYFTVYGPGQRPDMAFTRLFRALNGGTTFDVFGTGEQSRDVTYIDDAVRATALAMERGRAGAVYNVGGGTEASLNEVIALAESMSGRKLQTRFVDAAAGDVRRTAADTTRIQRELGWRPQTSLEHGLAAQLEWALETEPETA
jgi:UDP-glucuronate 4-epimerase